MGGGSFVAHVAHAAAAIRAGMCEVCLTPMAKPHAARGCLDSACEQLARDEPPYLQYEEPLGFVGPPVNYAIACTRYCTNMESADPSALAESPLPHAPAA